MYIYIWGEKKYVVLIFPQWGGRGKPMMKRLAQPGVSLGGGKVVERLIMYEI